MFTGVYDETSGKNSLSSVFLKIIIDQPQTLILE